MHLKITIEIDERQAGIVEKELSGTAEQIEELTREATQRTGRVILETALQQVEAACSLPDCCGKRMESRGQRTLTLVSTFGPLKVSRRRYRCSRCGEETYPMDTQWRCGGHLMTRPLAKRVCQLATSNHFPQLPGLLMDQHGIALQHEAMLQLVHDVGGVAESQRRLGAELRICRSPELGQQIRPEVQAQRVCVSCDGIMYCTNQTETAPDGSQRLIWQQMKVGCVFWQDAQEKWHKQLVWGRESPAEFGASLFEVACRCGYLQAQEKLFASDGGSWCWDIQARYFHDAQGILDYYHASEHVWEAARQVNQGDAHTKDWAKEALEQLWSGGATKLISWLEQQILSRRRKPRAALKSLRDYVAQHKDHMNYSDYRKAGWPIGTGIMESSCKQLVGLRLKGPGMHWTEAGALAVTALRTMELNQKWHQFWDALVLTA
jgi:hypothetical protein